MGFVFLVSVGCWYCWVYWLLLLVVDGCGLDCYGWLVWIGVFEVVGYSFSKSSVDCCVVCGWLKSFVSVLCRWLCEFGKFLILVGWIVGWWWFVLGCLCVCGCWMDCFSVLVWIVCWDVDWWWGVCVLWWCCGGF